MTNTEIESLLKTIVDNTNGTFLTLFLGTCKNEKVYQKQQFLEVGKPSDDLLLQLCATLDNIGSMQIRLWAKTDQHLPFALAEIRDVKAAYERAKDYARAEIISDFCRLLEVRAYLCGKCLAEFSYEPISNERILLASSGALWMPYESQHTVH